MGFLEIIGVLTLVSAGVGIVCGIIEAILPQTAILPIYRTAIGVSLFWVVMLLVEQWRARDKKPAGIPSEQKPLS